MKNGIAEKPPHEAIKEYLTEWGMKQKWLAEKTGISEEHISNILSGTYTLTDDNRKLINEVLDTDF